MELDHTLNHNIYSEKTITVTLEQWEKLMGGEMIVVDGEEITIFDGPFDVEVDEEMAKRMVLINRDEPEIDLKSQQKKERRKKARKRRKRKARK